MPRAPLEDAFFREVTLAAIDAAPARRWFSRIPLRAPALLVGSRPVRWFFDMISGDRPVQRDVSRMTVARPTEVVLMDDCLRLIDKLPEAYRKQLSAMPQTVERVARQVETLRTKAGAGDVQARERLARALAALDGLRIDLLRLSTNTTSTSLDEAIKAAAAMADDVDRVIAAEGDVRAMLKRPGVSTSG
jgi:hypothetical protein